LANSARPGFARKACRPSGWLAEEPTPFHGAARDPRVSFRLLASIDNTPYMAWMALVFTYSCRKHFPCSPMLAVHVKEGDEIRPEFRLAESAGATVAHCPHFTFGEGLVEYSPRNTPGALLSTPVDTDLVVLCDVDFVFLRPIRFDRLGAAPGVATMDTLAYMVTDSYDTATWLRPACARAGVDFDALHARGRLGGVPHVIHAYDSVRLARRWMDCIEHFVDTQPHPTDRIPWSGGMWAAVFAAEQEGIALASTDLATSNWDSARFDPSGPPIIHYCMRDATFNKHDFGYAATAWDVWDVKPNSDGTVSDRVRLEIAEAAVFYGLDDWVERPRLLGRDRNDTV
jgi:hypothetical protein